MGGRTLRLHWDERILQHAHNTERQSMVEQCGVGPGACEQLKLVLYYVSEASSGRRTWTLQATFPCLGSLPTFLIADRLCPCVARSRISPMPAVATPAGFHNSQTSPPGVPTLAYQSRSEALQGQWQLSFEPSDAGWALVDAGRQ